MTLVEEMAEFVSSSTYKALSDEAVLQLKVRVLDAIGCAIGALSAEPVARIRAFEDDFGGSPLCTLIGGGKTSPDRAALYNGALIRYLDFNDSFLAKGETCHPSDNVAPVLAASEYSKASGKDFLTALAVAYQVQCRMSEVAPVRAKGFDHTTQGAYAVAAGAARALSLSPAKAANAIAIAGTTLNALRVTRTGRLSNWKGLAYPFVSFGALTAVFMAMKGITGPLEVFEGNKGFMDSIAGKFEIDWERENLEAVTRTIVKKYTTRLDLQDKANPEHSAYWPRRPDMLMKRIVRGMLPYRRPRGKSAYRNLIVFTGLPEAFKGAKTEERGFKGQKGMYVKSIKFSELSKLLGYDSKM